MEVRTAIFSSCFWLCRLLPGLWSSVISIRPSRNLRCHSNTRALEQLELSFGLFRNFSRVRMSHSWLYTEFGYCQMLRTFSWRLHFCAIFSDAVASILNYAIVVCSMMPKRRDFILQIFVRRSRNILAAYNIVNRNANLINIALGAIFQLIQ